MALDPRDVATLLNMGRDPTQVDAEIQCSLYTGLLQRKRSVFYARGYGCNPMEKYPSGIQFVIGVAYQIASWVAARNKTTGDGSGSTVDRRAITSQALITVTGDGKGNADVSVIAIPMRDVKQRINLTVPMGGQ